MVHLQTFSSLRYAQCWEDADILLEGLDINNHDVCLSIASAGDNTLAMLAKNPKRVIAIDLNPTQIACLDLRVSAYQHLSYQELLEFMGSRPSYRRLALYQKCRDFVRLESTKTFWDAHIENFECYGIGGIGKFENYFRLF
jgi:S-adenosylmethionine-diacylglycerol 3-amino-3-carboxypropyl transferase